MSTHNLSVKVSVKGAVSVYGLGRFPVTLYPTQWVALMESGPMIAQFLADQSKTLEDQAERFKAAVIVAERKGISGKGREKEQDEFIRKLLGFESSAVSVKTGASPKASLVDELMRKASA